MPPKPLILAILDGWGHRDESADNAIATAHTPVLDGLTRDYPNGLINASELHVGLPLGQMGNSEVGHMNIGSGRVLMQELPRIDAAIADGSLGANPRFGTFVKSMAGARACHLIGLVSPGGVHAHHRHIIALARLLAGQGIAVRIHAILDGRDTPPQSAQGYVAELEKGIAGLAGAAIATVSGRYYAMDRDKRWDRVHKAYDAIAAASAPRFASAQEAIAASYAASVTDEFVLPCVIGDYQGVQDGEGLITANFRADRVREILAALLDPKFDGFDRARLPRFSAALGMTEYSSRLSQLQDTLLPPEKLTRIFGEIISEAGLRQLRIAETEKYAHVTFFFNGGREEEFPGEERILVPSPKVATYDLQPEMSAPEVTDRLVAAIESGRFDVIVVNYANTDMVGHTGDLAAARKAVETVDSCLGRVADAALARGGALFITADHGNAEMMFDHETHQPHTAHTLNLVPAIIVSRKLKGKPIPIREGKLGDVAPTLLQLLGLRQPPEMTGRSLLEGYEAA